MSTKDQRTEPTRFRRPESGKGTELLVRGHEILVAREEAGAVIVAVAPPRGGANDGAALGLKEEED